LPDELRAQFQKEAQAVDAPRFPALIEMATAVASSFAYSFMHRREVRWLLNGVRMACPGPSLTFELFGAVRRRSGLATAFASRFTAMISSRWTAGGRFARLRVRNRTPGASRSTCRSQKADARTRTGDPFITSFDQVPSPVVPSRAKPHESEESAQPRWRPKT
jgi:hypothetical protein